jgi:hypothetical protein
LTDIHHQGFIPGRMSDHGEHGEEATAAALVHAGVQGPGRGAVPARACELLKVAGAVYYAVRGGQPSDRDREDAGLLVTTKAEHKRSTGRYGAPRIHAELRHGAADAP